MRVAVGVFVLGLLTTLAEISEGLREFLTVFQGPVEAGPLAGKAVLSILAWLVSWAVLTLVWRSKDVDLRKMFYSGLALGMLGFIGTFPLFFQLFAAE